MSFLSNLRKAFHFGSNDAKKKKLYNNIKMDINPEEFWEMVGELGDGAFGKVYKAQHRQTHQLAAAKMCALEGEDDLSDFMIEIDILSECKHFNVVELHEAYFIDGKLWMLIEYCDGGAVDSIMIELEKGLTESQIAYICQHMTQGLAFLHKSKIIHRDLKAGNVLLTMTGGVKIGWQSMREKQQNFTKYKKLDISKADRKTVSKKRKDDEDDEKDTSVNISSKKIKRSELQKESENILMSTINKRTTNHPDISKIYSSNDELSTEEELSDDSENFTLRLSSLSDFNKQDSSILNLNKEINLNDIKKKLEQKDIEIAELKENLKHGIIEKERTEVELCSIKLDLETLKKKEQDVNNCTYTVNSAKNDLLKIKNLIERTINKLNGDEDLKQENENSQILLNIKEEKGKDDDKQQTFTLKASILGNCRKDTIENYAADLIDNCFVDTEFMNSSVTGKKCNANKEDDISDPKPALDSAKMNFIEKLVFKQFGTTRKVRSRIRKVASNKISQRRSNIN